MCLKDPETVHEHCCRIILGWGVKQKKIHKKHIHFLRNVILYIRGENFKRVLLYTGFFPKYNEEI